VGAGGLYLPGRQTPWEAAARQPGSLASSVWVQAHCTFRETDSVGGGSQTAVIPGGCQLRGPRGHLHVPVPLGALPVEPLHLHLRA